jgi:uncharacterized Zn-binding protein involved in type VI secretion
MPAIARVGDTVLSPDGAGKNCAFPLQVAIIVANDKVVRANGALIPVLNNPVPPHSKTGCDPDTSVLTSVSSTVRIGGVGVGRIGDKYGNNIITQGSPNVFAGG